AAAADFVIVLYNPASHKRKDYLSRACGIILKHKSSDTICGLVKNIGRDGQMQQITTLSEL
ncbi:MAG TPA: precorrin-3B C(17)-methyltransferase, partial [Lachnospiraceae bacterium]|nr:precorrin-3B C(17)-methyltransferase [Lachnospiraceae bacterium]